MQYMTKLNNKQITCNIHFVLKKKYICFSKIWIITTITDFKEDFAGGLTKNKFMYLFRCPK